MISKLCTQPAIQPIFCASFAKDDETKRILKREVEHPYGESEGLEYLYMAVAALDNLVSDDEIALKELDNKNIEITNTSTGASVEIRKSKFSDEAYMTENCPSVLSLGRAICAAIAENFGDMFEDTSIKDTCDARFSKHYIFNGKSRPARKHFADEYAKIDAKREGLDYRDSKDREILEECYDQEVALLKGKLLDRIG